MHRISRPPGYYLRRELEAKKFFYNFKVLKTILY